MKNILLVNASLNSASSTSTALGEELVESIVTSPAEVTRRSVNDLPAIDGDWIGACLHPC